MPKQPQAGHESDQMNSSAGATQIETLPLLDAENAIRDMGADQEGYCEVSAIFLEELPALLDLLELRSHGASATILPVIHEAANSLGVIGASRGEQRLRELEAVLRMSGGVTAQEASQSASAALQQAAGALRAWLAALG